MAVTMDWTYPLAANAILTDVQQIQAMLNACIKLTPAGNNIPTGAVKLASVTGGKQFQSYNGSAYASIGKLIHDSDQLDGYHASTSATANTIPVYNNSAQLVGSITGNAATATKLAAAKKIDIGGIATATEQNFDGSANITIPITQITVNNNDDNAINGVLTPAHGGTGNTTGAASDITVSGNAGNNLSAKAYGQIGQAVGLGTKDLNSLTTDGFYVGSSSTSHTVAQHYPLTATANAALRVSTSGNFVMQHLMFGQGTWLRWSDDKGATWKPWQAEGGTVAADLTIYISKSGSDNNTGLTSDLPVLTFNRAIQIANGRLQSTSGGVVGFRFGAGNWGNVTIMPKPYYIQILPYDGAAATEFSEDLPVFGTLTFQGSHAQVTSVVANVLTASCSGFIYVTNGLLRVGQIYARQGSHIFIANHATNPIEVMNTNQSSVFCALHNGVINNYGSRKVKIVESIAPSNAFCYLTYTGKMTYVEGLTYEYASGATVTGKRASVAKGSFLSTVSANTFPGTVANDFAEGAIINGIPHGDGTTTKYLRADGSWQVPPNTIYTHPSYTARTGVPTANAAPAFGGTFTVNQVNCDNTGHVTAVTSRTITIPSTAASASTAGLVTTGNQTFAGTKTFNSPISGSVTGSSGSCTGNAATATTATKATKLATARNFRTNLASTSTASFDGSAACSPGVTGVLGVANGGTGNTTGVVSNTDATKNVCIVPVSGGGHNLKLPSGGSWDALYFSTGNNMDAVNVYCVIAGGTTLQAGGYWGGGYWLYWRVA